MLFRGKRKLRFRHLSDHNQSVDCFGISLFRAYIGQPNSEQQVTTDRLMYMNSFLIYNESNMRIFSSDNT